MRKAIAVLATVAIVLGGFAAVVIVQSPNSATAQEEAEDTGITPAAPVGIDEILSDLVDEGVITREQADQVAAALRERLGEFPGHHLFGRGFHLETAARTVGIEVDDLVSALRDGQTIAEVADANGVRAQTVVNALVADMNERLDQAVEDGKLTTEQADGIRAEAPDRITAMVNGECPGGFGGGFRGHHSKGFGPAADDSSNAAGTGA